MRFVPDGPDIPDDLIDRWREGNVIFLVGAGISMPEPSKLPNFRGLALDVYERLGQPLHEVLRRAWEARPDHRFAILDNAGLRPRERVEADLFFEDAFDRLFSALETRLDKDARGSSIGRRVRDTIEARLRQHGGHGQGHRDLIRLSTMPRATGRIEAGEACRIVTTNFDRLLEEAWAAELPFPCRCYDARVAPRPGAYDFDGVVHLHGVLDADPNQPCDMVLSSRDFARVYLRSGVVANYVYDLVRRFTVVLVGYRAEDPVMRYLMDAINEDSALFNDMRRPYAIAAHDQSDPIGDLTAARWQVKNFEPVLYNAVRHGQVSHAPLWETLKVWAEWYRGGRDWVIDRLRNEMALPPTSSDDFRRSFVRDLLKALDEDDRSFVVRRLAAAHPQFAWIDVIDEAASFSSPRSGGRAR